MSQTQGQAQLGKESGPTDTKDRMGKPKAGNSIKDITVGKRDTNMVGGTIVKPVRTTKGI